MFTKAKQTGKQRVSYWNEDGSGETRIGGNWTWRNQNPGNIGGGAWATRHGAIGKAGGFAVFPNYDVGRTAIFDLLKGPDFRNLTIWNAIPRYAPAEDKNDVSRYRTIVRDASKLDLERAIKSLTEEELDKLVSAIERVEGKFKSGRIEKIQIKQKISAVKKNKRGIITEYYVKGLGWLSKERAVRFVKLGRIDAVVSHSRAGIVYLKTRPDQLSENNLKNLG